MIDMAKTTSTVAGSIPIGQALDNAKMSKLHVTFWFLGGLGIMLDGFDFFIIGVANPLIKQDLGASSVETGLISTAAIVGAFVGATFLGPSATSWVANASSATTSSCSWSSRWRACSRGTFRH